MKHKIFLASIILFTMMSIVKTLAYENFGEHNEYLVFGKDILFEEPTLKVKNLDTNDISTKVVNQELYDITDVDEIVTIYTKYTAGNILYIIIMYTFAAITIYCLF